MIEDDKHVKTNQPRIHWETIHSMTNDLAKKQGIPYSLVRTRLLSELGLLDLSKYTYGTNNPYMINLGV